MILRYVVLTFCCWVSPAWSVIILGGNDELTLLFFEALEKEDYTMLSACIFNLPPYPVVLKNSDGDTPLHWAIRKNNENLVQWFLERQYGYYDSKEKDSAGQTPLDLALQSDNKNLVALMGSYINAKFTIALEACMHPKMLTKEHVLLFIDNMQPELVKRSVKYIGNCNELVLGTTLLHRAIVAKSFEIVKILLQAGADREQADASGITAFEKAHDCLSQARQKLADTTTMLVKVKAQQEQQMGKAQEKKVPESIEQDYQDDYNAVQCYDILVDLMTQHEKNKKILLFWFKKLLESNCSTSNNTDEQKDTQGANLVYLHMLARDISLNTRDKQGNTLLHKAVEARNIELMKLLLMCGASPFTPDFVGQTAFDKAVVQADAPLYFFIELAYLFKAQLEQQANTRGAA